MRRLSLEEALKTPNIKFKVTQKQCKIIAKILNDDVYLKKYAIVISSAFNIGYYWKNDDDINGYFYNNWSEEIKVITE